MYQKANCSYSAPNEIITCFQLRKSPFWSREDPTPALFLTPFPRCHRLVPIHHRRHAARLCGPVNPRTTKGSSIRRDIEWTILAPRTTNTHRRTHLWQGIGFHTRWWEPARLPLSETSFQLVFPVTVGGSERPISAGLLTPAAQTGPKGKWALPFPLTTISFTVL